MEVFFTAFGLKGKAVLEKALGEAQISWTNKLVHGRSSHLFGSMLRAL